MRKSHCVALHERLQRIRHLVGPRHGRLADQDRDHTLAQLQRLLDLDADEVQWIVEPSVAGAVAGIQPFLAEDGEQDVASLDLVAQDFDEIVAGGDAVDIHEQPVGQERLRSSLV